jgi:hypothetical protein
MINASYLAVLYFNIIKPNYYDIQNKQDRKRAYKAFDNSSFIDKEVLLQAIEKYKEMLSNEFDVFVQGKTKL